MEHPAFFDCPLAFTSQFPVVTEPVNAVVSDPIWHPGPVCNVMLLLVYSLTPSIMSISPPFGQLGPSVQNLHVHVSLGPYMLNRQTYAGQVPQPNGMCATSRTMSPLLYFFLLSIRMLGRPSGVLFVTSTPNCAAVVIDALMRFDFLAVASSTNLTKPRQYQYNLDVKIDCYKPCVGSGPVKKLKLL
jgi:hypothetical protein